jgi:hypothetical protein
MESKVTAYQMKADFGRKSLSRAEALDMNASETPPFAQYSDSDSARQVRIIKERSFRLVHFDLTRIPLSHSQKLEKRLSLSH